MAEAMNSAQATQPVEGNVPVNNIDPAEYARLKSERDDLDRKNRDLFARAKQAEADKYKMKAEMANLQANRPNQPMEPMSEMDEFKSSASRDDVDMAYLAARGYSDDEISSLSKIARGAGKRLREAVNEPEAQAVIEWRRAQQKVAQATPPPSGRVMAQPMNKSWDAMSNTERRANFEAYRDTVVGGGN